jgi:integrase
MANDRITKRSVDAHKCEPGKDRSILWDDAIAGFGIAAFPTGRKVYIAQFRKDGRSRRVKIGTHGRMTPDEARIEARKLLGGVEKGIDVVAQRRAARSVPTFGDVADRFLSEHVARKRKTRTHASYDLLIRKHIKPAIGSMRIPDVRRADLDRLHASMGAMPGAANRALSLVSAIWNWAAKRDLVRFEENPAKGIERNPEKAKERFLSTVELGRLGDALRLAETTGLPYAVDEAGPKAKHAAKPEKRLRRIDPFAVAAIRLLLLTGARLREILHARWNEVDFDRGIIFLPDSKTGRKPLLLSAAAQAIIADLPRIEGNPYIIAGAGNGPRADLKRPWAAITHAANLPGVRLHDLRHSFASIGAGASLGLSVVGKLLGHTQPQTTARYAHLDADPLRRAADTIGAVIDAAMNRKAGGEVVPMKRPG